MLRSFHLRFIGDLLGEIFFSTPNEARSYLFPPAVLRPLELLTASMSCASLQGDSVHFEWDAWDKRLGQGCC